MTTSSHAPSPGPVGRRGHSSAATSETTDRWVGGPGLQRRFGAGAKASFVACLIVPTSFGAAAANAVEAMAMTSANGSPTRPGSTRSATRPAVRSRVVTVAATGRSRPPVVSVVVRRSTRPTSPRTGTRPVSTPPVAPTIGSTPTSPTRQSLAQTTAPTTGSASTNPGLAGVSAMGPTPLPELGLGTGDADLMATTPAALSDLPAEPTPVPPAEPTPVPPAEPTPVPPAPEIPTAFALVDTVTASPTVSQPTAPPTTAPAVSTTVPSTTVPSTTVPTAEAVPTGSGPTEDRAADSQSADSQSVDSQSTDSQSTDSQHADEALALTTTTVPVRRAAPNLGSSQLPSSVNMLPTVSSDTTIVESTNLGNLLCVYNGQGIVEMQPTQLHMVPKVATGPVLNEGSGGYVTHATLVVGTATSASEAYQLDVTMTTVRQLRVLPPGAWERGWVLFDYIDASNFGYLILKSTGWELGRLVNGGQVFDATGTDVLYPVGQTDRVLISRSNDAVRVEVNGVVLVNEAPGTRSAPRAQTGVYSEDADVTVSGWTVSRFVPRPAATITNAGAVTGGRSAAPSN